MSPASRIALLLLLLGTASGAFLWWRHQRAAPAIGPPLATPAAHVSSPVAPPPADVTAIHYPVPSAPGSSGSARPSPHDADDQVRRALLDLLGRKPALALLNLDGVVRRFVATVDNLATDNAPAQMWPVRPAAGHLETVARDGGTAISGDNADRYAGFVRLIEGVDTQRAVAVYLRLYPLFQRAYEELGYPGRYFNDRVVEVIDNLLATPTIAGPIRVEQLRVEGGAQRGAGLYVFADPALETHTAGQKILLRIGQDNAAKLMTKLTDIRRQLVTAAAPGRRASTP